MPLPWYLYRNWQEIQEAWGYWRVGSVIYT
jgi:hypothetical protein